MPDPTQSLADGALAPWSGARSEYFSGLVSGGRRARRLLGRHAVGEAEAKADQKLVLYGAGDKQVHLKYRNRYGRQRSFHSAYEGIVPWLRAPPHRGRVGLPAGQPRGVPAGGALPGVRRRPAQARVAGRAPSAGYNIYALCSLSIGTAVEVVGSLDLSDRDHLIADRVFREVPERMQFLLDVGLDYLSLARSAATLSGGEAQRIRLASQIGSGLVGVLYVLDEPSIGLHQRDNQRLIGTLERLRDLGNTVIVVEHDEETIRVADHVVDVGPGPGSTAGRIVHSGPGDRHGRDPRSQSRTR